MFILAKSSLSPLGPIVSNAIDINPLHTYQTYSPLGDP